MMRNLQNIESMLDEMDLRVAATVPEEAREYLYSGIRTIRNDLYIAMRFALSETSQ